MPTYIATMKNVRIHAPIGKEIFIKMKSADALLVVLPENKKDERTTKFYEYLPLRKPMLIVAPEGEVTAYVEAHSLGVHSSQSAEVLLSFFNREFSRNIFNSHFAIDEQTADSRAKEVIELLS